MQNYNFVKGIDPKTGELIGRRDFTAGKQTEPALPGDRRRRELEFRQLQPEDRDSITRSAMSGA